MSDQGSKLTYPKFKDRMNSNSPAKKILNRSNPFITIYIILILSEPNPGHLSPNKACPLITIHSSEGELV